jgi:hypothetical protein
MHLLASCGNCLDLQYCTKVAYNCPWCAYHPLVPITLCSVSATLCGGRTRNYWPAPDGCPQCSELHCLFNFVRWFLSSHVFLSDLFSSFSNKFWWNQIAKMWGPGAEQGGILQTSSCKLDLKEPYYRMSQPQTYAMAQDQQPHQPIHAQVTTKYTISFNLYDQLVRWRKSEHWFINNKKLDAPNPWIYSP